MVITKNTRDNVLARVWRKGNSLCTVGRDINWSFLKKTKIELPYDPAILFLGIYPETKKTLIQKNTCTPMFIT